MAPGRGGVSAGLQVPSHVDGSVVEPTPSPRAMDTLACEIRGDEGQEEVWVKFENYYSGRADKVVKA